MPENLTSSTPTGRVQKALREALSSAATAAADIARYCDHAEHNEPLDRVWVSEAAAILRHAARNIADALGVDLIQAYADRLRDIEARNVLLPVTGYDGFAAVGAAKTLRELQSIQAQHDRNFHPDVFGLSKAEQLRHYALHATKIVGSLALACEDEQTWDDFTRRRLPDMFLFGLKLATVMGESLPDEPIEYGEQATNYRSFDFSSKAPPRSQ
jgi:hypothetical protein